MPEAGVRGEYAPNAAETLLAFDFGVRRIGVALGNTLTGSARALEVFDSVPIDRRFAHIAALIQAWQPDRLVVGRPLDEDGTPTETTRLAERFANQLRGRFGDGGAWVLGVGAGRKPSWGAGGGRPGRVRGV